MQKLTALQNNFVSEIKSFGYTPSLLAPRILIDNPRSFGNYENGSNILHTSDWKTLPAEGQGFFASLAGQLKNETGEDVFDKAAHRWIFIHEMGHWWRACQHEHTSPYDNEKAANRIAMAYWREHDPEFMKFMLGIFQNVVDHVPSPVPAGQSEKDFLNNNYQKLPGGAAYSWYQSKMIVDASKQKPVLSFQQVIAKAGN